MAFYGRDMAEGTEEELSDLDIIRRSGTVSMEIASRVLGIGLSTAHRAAARTGEVVPGVPVVRLSQRRVRVLTQPLLRLLEIDRDLG